MWGFVKKDIKEKKFSLPELPKLPEFPTIDEAKIPEGKKFLHQLPSFPSSSFGEKLSQNTIKDAVAGKDTSLELPKLEEMEFPEKESYEREILPPKKEFRKEIPRPYPEMVKKIEPVFIRIDKFEESMKIFEKTKEKILEIEHMLRDIKDIREKEEEELQVWENNMKKMKEEIERIDQEIFSKI